MKNLKISHSYFSFLHLCFVLALGVLLSGIYAEKAFASIEALALRNAQHKGYHRMVVELQEATPYKVFTLANPNRLVVDLADTIIPPTLSFRADGIAIAFRQGLFRNNISRIVVELSSKAKILQVRILPPSDNKPHRLLVDFSSGNPASSKEKIVESSGWSAFFTQATNPPALKPVASSSSKPIIVIDPGHGGIDPGAIGKFHKTKEKHVVLSVSKKIESQLKKLNKYQVVLTRDQDVFIKLRDRTNKATALNADLFISVHADSFKKASVRGLSVYALSDKGSDAEARLIAEQENRSDLIAGADLSEFDSSIADILIDLQQSETKIESVVFSDYLIQSMKSVTNLKRDTLRFAGFVVLKSPTVPSLLVELGYLSNKYEETQLRKDSYRTKLAKSIASAIDQYFERRLSHAEK